MLPMKKISRMSSNFSAYNASRFLELNQEASDLYGLIHARFILTPRGLAKVYQKFLSGTYGYCPRALCDRQKVLPVGLSDQLKTSRFKVFCPRCEEVYLPKVRSVNIDGAYFGSSFPHVFLKHYPEAIVLPPKIYHYEPKIYGFHIYGKRGSKYFNPPKGGVKFVEDSMTSLEKENLALQLKQGAKEGVTESFQRLQLSEKLQEESVKPAPQQQQSKKKKKQNKKK